VLSIALGREVRSGRFKEVVRPAERHRMHHLEVHRPDEIDDEVVEWLAEAYERAGGRPAHRPVHRIRYVPDR